MTLNMSQALNWFSDQAESGNVRKPGGASRHIDELVPGLVQSDWVGATLSVLSEIAQRAYAEPLIAIACFPLGVSEKIGQVRCSWQELPQRIADEPPSIYLIGGPESISDGSEEHRTPLSAPLLNNLVEQTVYLRSYRTAEGYLNDWEFENVVYVEIQLRTEGGDEQK